jgi:ABC-type multidrug transport system permease subunit
VKEIREILGNKYLLFLLLVPPILQLLILGSALDPQVHKASIGVVDYDRSHESRDLLTAIAESGIFSKRSLFPSETAVAPYIERGQLNMALIIPQDFSHNLELLRPAQVQVIVDGSDAYTAGIASAYITRIIYHWRPGGSVGARDQITARAASLMSLSEAQREEQMLSGANGSPAGGGSSAGAMKLFSGDIGSGANSDSSGSQVSATTPTQQLGNLIEPRTLFLYNPGQVSSWLFVPGVLGAVLTLTSTLVASAAILRERESGTIDQLMMTPAETWEILVAKVIPLMIFMLADVALAIIVSRVAFGMPFRGSILAFALGSAFYLLTGIGMGMLLGSLCRSQRQAQLSSFFINIPVILLS